MTTLIVSAPHSRCPENSKIRLCDTAAGLAASTFCRAAEVSKRIRCILLPGDEFRVNHDLNRKTSRDTPYRKRLEKIFQEMPSRCLVTDIHSFPDYYMKEAGDINFFKPGETPPELVILQGPMDVYRGKSLCNVVYDALIKAKVHCKIVRGITVNDILNNGAEHSIAGALFEFNEKFNEDPDRLYKICRVITKTLASL